jgi:hypothetical protein
MAMNRRFDVTKIPMHPFAATTSALKTCCCEQATPNSADLFQARGNTRLTQPHLCDPGRRWATARGSKGRDNKRSRKLLSAFEAGSSRGHVVDTNMLH